MRKRYAIAVLAAVPLVAGAATVVPSLAATTPAVSFTKIQFDSPGSDNRSNTSLNAEWVRLTNNTRAGIQLKGWTVRDRSNHVFTFGTYTLGAGKLVYVHTGKGKQGKPDVQHVYQQRAAYVWNNDGDAAYLRNATGKAVDSCSWRAGTKPTYC